MSSFDRAAVMEAAEKAQRRGRIEKAIAEYQRILAMDPGDPAIHGRLAPLLARLGLRDEAWRSFELQARHLIRGGFADKAIGVYAHAAKLLPRRTEVWGAMAELHLEVGRRADALKVLLAGAARLRGRRTRNVAVQLLRRAYEVEPGQPHVVFALARLLSRQGNTAEALRVLEELCARSSGRDRRRARGLQFRLSPTPAALWRWLRALPGK